MIGTVGTVEVCTIVDMGDGVRPVDYTYTIFGAGWRLEVEHVPTGRARAGDIVRLTQEVHSGRLQVDPLDGEGVRE